MQVGNRLAQLVLVNLFLTPVAAPGDAFKKEIGALETENFFFKQFHVSTSLIAENLLFS